MLVDRDSEPLGGVRDRRGAPCRLAAGPWTCGTPAPVVSQGQDLLVVMPLRYRYRLDPQDRKLVVADSGATTDDWIRDTIDVLICFRTRTHDCRGARNRARSAVTCAEQPLGAGPAGNDQGR